MGGTIAKDDVTKFSFELEISQLKLELNSNVIPIGMVELGIYYHRALLFKVRFRGYGRLFVISFQSHRPG